jgi:hypothetical protein
MHYHTWKTKMINSEQHFHKLCTIEIANQIKSLSYRHHHCDIDVSPILKTAARRMLDDMGLSDCIGLKKWSEP